MARLFPLRDPEPRQPTLDLEPRAEYADVNDNLRRMLDKMSLVEVTSHLESHDNPALLPRCGSSYEIYRVKEELVPAAKAFYTRAGKSFRLEKNDNVNYIQPFCQVSGWKYW